MPSFTTTTSTTWPVPSNADVSSVQVYAIGESGNAGTSVHGSNSGGGSGGGACGGEPALGGLVAGVTVLTITVPQGGTGNPTTVTGGSVTVQANAGASATGQTKGAGGAAGTNAVAFKGGDGANGITGATQNGGGGGGSAGSTGAGGNASTSTGGAAGTGAAGPPSLAGAAGASGAGTSANGVSGTAPGGGASGGGSGGAINHTGGAGLPGQVIIIWNTITASPAGYLSFTGIAATAIKATTAVKGYLSLTGAPPRITVTNQWAGTFAQPSAFGTTPPALQGVPVALTPANSIGGGTGYSTPGNWLFCVVGINEFSATAGVTVGDADDIHSFWRPGDVTQSTWAVSTGTAMTRTSVWYTANIARQVNYVYVAPSGCADAISVLVFEVQGLGAWDVVTGVYSNYAAAATSLNLALAAPSAAAFLVAAVTGDNSTAGQAFAPSGWTPLQTVTASNGTDHTADCVLTAATLLTAGAVSVNGTASSAVDLSGVVIGVLTSAPSPIPAGADGGRWPGRVILEAAFGAGYETPPDQCTWTALSDSTWPGPWGAGGNVKRFWGWTDRSSIPWGLGQYQSSAGSITLDNTDGNLSPANSASPWYPHVTAGTPVRLRMALGTVTTREGSVTYNRWHVWQRNAQSFPEKRDDALRGYVQATTTDVWQSASGTCPTPYRAEVEQDLAALGPGWWWPMDDQPLAGGVLPTSLRNAATGSSTVMQIIASPNGVPIQHQYASNLNGSPGGTDLTAAGGNSPVLPGLAVYAVAQQQGWMWGDPQVSPQSAQTGNPVTAQPGSAAWQQSGLLGNTGANGWFLAANDNFPAIASGVTVTGWFNVGFFGSAAGYTNNVISGQSCGQPYSVLTLAELATATAPVALLQLDLNGHLSLITYNGGTPTSNAVYSASDLRCNSWIRVTLELTQTSYTVYLNGGLTAAASGSCTISASAWSWLIVNGDLGSGGGSTLSGIGHCWNGYASHWAVCPGILPKYRELAQYCAAITGFGTLPAPVSVALSAVSQANYAHGSTPDGAASNGAYANAGAGTVFGMSAVAAAVAGPYTSGPSARAAVTGTGSLFGSTWSGSAVFASWTSIAPLVQVFTAASVAAETEASAALGQADTYTGGFGGSATGAGPCHVSGGTGASPPSAPSPLGDTVQQRLERILSYGSITVPMRAIDPAPLQVQAALDVGGQQVGASVTAIAGSDSGWWYTDLCGVLNYRSRPHLNADTPVWLIGMNVPAGYRPFAADETGDTDSQRVFTVITVQPYSPDGAALADLVPADFAAANAAQAQYGPRPFTVTSYLQDPAEQQAQADWLLAYYGTPRKRIVNLTIDAASHPAAWGLVLGLNLADVVQVYEFSFGAPVSVTNYRVSSVSRQLSFGANRQEIVGKVTISADPLPPAPGYWT